MSASDAVFRFSVKSEELVVRCSFGVTAKGEGVEPSESFVETVGESGEFDGDRVVVIDSHFDGFDGVERAGELLAEIVEMFDELDVWGGGHDEFSSIGMNHHFLGRE
jgi:hypothetical protein